MCYCYGKIVDVDLAALPLELFQLVGRDSSYDLTVLQRSERNEVIGAEQSFKIVRTGLLPAVGLHLVESIAESRQQRFHQRLIVARELVNAEAGRGGHAYLSSCITSCSAAGQQGRPRRTCGRGPAAARVSGHDADFPACYPP